MTSFHSRIESSDAEAVWRALRENAMLDDSTKSVLVHDLSRMRSRLRRLQDCFPPSALHAVAIKANPVVEVLREAVDCGAGLEAASLEELHLALAANCPPPKIVFDSPAKTVSEIREAFEHGVVLNIDNFDEMNRVAGCLESNHSNSAIGIRINPEVSAGTISHTSVGSIGSKFGVSISQDRVKIIAAFVKFPWLTGLHVHIGSQGCGMELLVEAIKKVAGLREEIESATGRTIPMLNIGGGLPARYDDVTDPPSPHQYANAILECVPNLWESHTQLVTEFGRSIQAGCGIAFSRVEYTRSVGHEDEMHMMAVIHLGADFLLRPVYRPQDWKHEFFVLDQNGNVKTGPTQSVTIAGPLCFSGDILARQIALPKINPGDWIAIRDCGAYTLSMWSRHCSRGIPTVIGYDAETNEAKILRRQETPQSIVDFWSR